MVSKYLISSKMRAKLFFRFNRKKFKVHAFIKDDKKIPKEFLSPYLLIYGKYIRLLLCLVFIKNCNSFLQFLHSEAKTTPRQYLLIRKKDFDRTSCLEMTGWWVLFVLVFIKNTSGINVGVGISDITGPAAEIGMVSQNKNCRTSQF